MTLGPTPGVHAQAIHTERGGPAKDAPITVPGTSPPPPMRVPGTAPDIGALDVNLGPIDKEVLVGEETGLDDLRRIAAIPDTRVGLVLVGGNTLRPDEVRRLSRLPRVDLWLTAPVLRIHVRVLRRVHTQRDVTVVVPPGRKPGPHLVDLLSIAGPGRTNVVLEGRPTPERIAPLTGLSHGELVVRLPPGGLSAPVQAALRRAARADLVVLVPKDAAATDLAGLDRLGVRTVVLETDANRVDPHVARAVARMKLRARVVLDAHVTPEDLHVLRRLPRLEIRVRLDPTAPVPARLLALLRATEGERGRAPAEAAEAAGPSH